MALETAATIAELNPSNPVGASDSPSTLDDHIRLLKTVLQADALVEADIGVTVQSYDADIPTVAASQGEMEAGTEAALRSMSPLRIAQAIEALSPNVGGFKNKIINGAFDVWQRGTSFGATGYTADRWIAYFSTGTTTFAYTADSPSGILSSIYVASTASNAPQLYQRVESYNAAPLEGQKATLSFYAKQTAGSSQLTASLSYANASDNFSGTTAIEGFSALTLTSGWVRYSFTTASAMPAGTVNGVQVVLAKGNSDTSTWLVTGVQLEAGSVATPFETRSIGQELALCQRYYEKSFPSTSAPQQNLGINTGEYQAPATRAGAAVGWFPFVNFKVDKRANPTTLILYNPVAANAQIYNAVAGTSGTLSNVNNVTQRGFTPYCTGAAGWSVGDVCALHWTAEAEL